MLYQSSTYLQEDLEYHLNLSKLYKMRLKNLPAGRLETQTKGDCTYYVKVNGGERTYLGKEDPLIDQLKERYFLTKALEQIEQNIKILHLFLKKYHTFTPEEISQSFPKAYVPLPPNCFDLSGFTDLTKWETAPYKKSTKFLDQCKHRTIKGDLVRSKSEVILANAFTAKGIPYHYEEELQLSNITLVPDFKIGVRRENRFKYLEHCGMISDYYYRQMFHKKLDTYLDNGFLPGRDVIFTFDDQDGNIDTLLIDQIIKAYLI